MRRFSSTRLVRLSGTWLLVILLAAAGLSSAQDEARRSSLQQYIGGTNGADRLERIENTLSGSCRCSDAEPLSGTHGLLFNCICGSMQCVVAGQRNGADGANGGFDLFCR